MSVATPTARRKRVRATQEASLTTPTGSVVTFQVDLGPEVGDPTTEEHAARLAYNRQSRCRALAAHKQQKKQQLQDEKVRRPSNSSRAAP